LDAGNSRKRKEIQLRKAILGIGKKRKKGKEERKREGEKKERNEKIERPKIGRPKCKNFINGIFIVSDE